LLHVEPLCGPGDVAFLATAMKCEGAVAPLPYPNRMSFASPGLWLDILRASYLRQTRSQRGRRPAMRQLIASRCSVMHAFASGFLRAPHIAQTNSVFQRRVGRRARSKRRRRSPLVQLRRILAVPQAASFSILGPLPIRRRPYYPAHAGLKGGPNPVP
jgi:hypothetical protein